MFENVEERSNMLKWGEPVGAGPGEPTGARSGELIGAGSRAPPLDVEWEPIQICWNCFGYWINKDNFLHKVNSIFGKNENQYFQTQFEYFNIQRETYWEYSNLNLKRNSLFENVEERSNMLKWGNQWEQAQENQRGRDRGNWSGRAQERRL